MTRKTGVAVSIALLCVACGPKFNVEPSGTGTAINLTFDEWEPGLWGSSRNAPRSPCIATLTVLEAGEGSRRGNVVWQVSATGSCVGLRRVDLGSVPSGFVETANHLPLRIGQAYVATARAGNTLRISQPWVVCSGAPAILSDNDYWLVDPPRRCRA